VDGLIDTSVLIASERGRALRDHPDHAAISVMTLAELHAGVLAARDASTRARRLQTLASVENSFDPLPVDPNVARRFAELAVAAREDGRRAPVVDLLIAATASVHGLPLYTQDGDFLGLPGIDVVVV
jgi:predicted nucleic acid-binding protein